MPDSFFTKKRKRTINTVHPKRKEEELDSATDDDDHGNELDDVQRSDDNVSDDEDVNETPAEKRLRLAKLYVASLKEDIQDGGFDAAEIDRDIIAARLQKDVREHSGKVHLFLADSLPKGSIRHPSLRTQGHRLPVTATVASQDGSIMFTAGKDGHIIQWDVITGKRKGTFRKLIPPPKKNKGKGKAVDVEANKLLAKAHTDEILTLAMSEDGKYLVSGGKDRKIIVWDVAHQSWLRTFQGHKDVISSLAFRRDSLQMYSASYDRTVKLFDLSVMGYVETLFGHQDSVLSVDCLRGETAVTCGGRDKSVRFWKITDESQLVFRAGGLSKVRAVLEGGLEDVEAIEESTIRHQTSYMEGSVDCVAMIDESTFLSGGDSGSICLWSIAKKKPLFTQALAHGFDEHMSTTEGIIRIPRWITSLASFSYSDLFASGSWDGAIRLWKVDSSLRSFHALHHIAAQGVINSLQFVHPPSSCLVNATWISGHETENQPSARDRDILLVAGVGQEPRLGRWNHVKGINGAEVFCLTRSQTL